MSERAGKYKYKSYAETEEKMVFFIDYFSINELKEQKAINLLYFLNSYNNVIFFFFVKFV